MSESKRNDYGTGIPESAMEALARALLPEIRKFYEMHGIGGKDEDTI